jgi:hypothetical protein
MEASAISLQKIYSETSIHRFRQGWIRENNRCGSLHKMNKNDHICLHVFTKSKTYTNNVIASTLKSTLHYFFLRKSLIFICSVAPFLLNLNNKLSIQWNLYLSFPDNSFPRSVVQFLWSLSESYLNYGNKTLINHSSSYRIYWSEFLVLTKVNPGLIVFKKEQHHTQMLVCIGSSNGGCLWNAV